MLDFHGALKQTIIFTGVFLFLWLIQHISDFRSSLKPDHHYSRDMWYHLNEILKGIGGLVTFLTWYFSRTMKQQYDEIETPVSMDTYNNLNPPGYLTEDSDDGRMDGHGYHYHGHRGSGTISGDFSYSSKHQTEPSLNLTYSTHDSIRSDDIE